jgi:glutathione S-transferase
MSRIQLFSNALCPYAQRVRLALAEKGLEVAEIEIDPRDKPAEFLALSPAGKCPILVHDGISLWESAVINEYLEDRFPEHPLLPRAAAQRALARIWVNFADLRLYEPTHRLLLSADPDVQGAIANQLDDELRFLETRVLAAHAGPYWIGDEFGLADIAFFPWFEQLAVLERFRKFRMPGECSRLLAWRDTVARRQAVQTTAKSSDFYLHGYAQLAAGMLRNASAA